MNDSKPKVLILLDRLVIGGQAVDVIPLCYYLQSSFDIQIAYGKKKKEDTEAHFLLTHYSGLAIHKLRFLQKTSNPFTNLLAYFEIKQLIRSTNPNILHTNAVKCGVLGRWAAYRLKTPVIIHTFHGHFFHSYFNILFSKAVMLIENKLATLSDAIIATSKAQATDLVQLYKITSLKKVHVITLGLDNYFFQKQIQNQEYSFLQAFPVAEKTITIGIIARIVKVKNFQLFVQVVKKVITASEKQVQFFVIGDGHLKTSIQQSLTQNGVTWCEKHNYNASNNVVFTSWMPYVVSALQTLDISILTSNNEGTGLSLAESQFFGKPVVATAVGGVVDTVINGETGFLVPENNVDAFAEKLLLLVNDDSLRLKMGIAAKQFAQEKFSKQAEVNQISNLYRTLLVENNIAH